MDRRSSRLIMGVALVGIIIVIALVTFLPR
jgi:hypothetical protein